MLTFHLFYLGQVMICIHAADQSKFAAISVFDSFRGSLLMAMYLTLNDSDF